jgi:multiple antibiotic resistance protein
MEHSGPEAFVLSFVPLFIVIDALGILPFILTLGSSMSTRERRKMIHIATFTAVVVGLAFLFFGRFILNVMGISVGAFAIAGGVILLVLSINYILTGRMVEAVKEEMVAVVPVGTPLMAGPATITTLLLLVTQFPLYIVLLALLLNLLIAWLIFLLGNIIARLLGKGGLNAVSKIFNLLLAAIAVSMVIRGLELLEILDITT